MREYYKKYLEAVYFNKYKEIYLNNIKKCNDKKELEEMQKEYNKQLYNLIQQKEISLKNINKVISDRHYHLKEKNKIIGYKYSGVIENRLEAIEKKEIYYIIKK